MSQAAHVDTNVHRLHPQWTTWWITMHLLGLTGLVYACVEGISGRAEILATVAFALLFMRAELYSITLLHRHVAHKSFDTTWWVRAVMFVLFFSTLEAWAKAWVGWHRQHHARTDTRHDRHSPRYWKSFFHAQGGWHMKTAFLRPAPNMFISDLTKEESRSEFDPLTTMDERYKWWAIGMSFVLPTLVCGFGWGDWWGGLLFAGFTRLVLVQHLTSTINSISHMWGDTVEEGSSATNTRSNFFAWLVVGEPWHGNHHKVSNSYRFGWDPGQCDPGANFIEWLARRGWAWNLRTRGEILYKRVS